MSTVFRPITEPIIKVIMKPLIWLPALAFVITAAFVALSFFQQRQTVRTMEQLFARQAEAIHDAVQEGTREAVFSTSMLMELSEGNDALMGELRREIGIGPFLKGIVRHDIAWVALQDETGIIAMRPVDANLTAFESDGLLAEVLNREFAQSRLLPNATTPVFEGLYPFSMVDGSTVLLRIGIRAESLIGAQQDLYRWFYLALLLGVLFSGSMVAMAVLTYRWQKRRDAAEATLQARESAHKHWEMMGEMAATVAHEVRNPLSTIQMIAQRLGVEFEVTSADKEEFSTMCGILQSETLRLEKLVSEFLELGKPLNLQLKAVDVNEILNEAVTPFSMQAAQQQVQFELSLNRDLPLIKVDVARFNQIVKNLLQNALDAVKDNGTIWVETGRTPAGISVVISDNGVGIDAEEQPNVFKPFVSFKANGTGLGLPLVKRLSDAMNARIELESAPSQGTRIALVFVEKGSRHE